MNVVLTTSRKFRRRAFVIAVVLISTTLIIASSVWDLTTFPPPPGTGDYVSSFFLGYLGLWDAAMARAQRARSEVLLASEPSAEARDDIEDRLASIHRRIASLHERMGQYDEAAEVMEREVLPRLRGRMSGGDPASVTRAQVWELGMTDLSELYRRRGLYREGLKKLAEAQEEYDSAFSPPPAVPDDGGGTKGRSRFNDALASLTQSTLQKEHDIRGEEMRELASDLERNVEYVALVEETARKYEFSTRRRIVAAPTTKTAAAEVEVTEGGNSGQRAEEETCPIKQRCSHNIRRTALYAPSDALFGTTLAILLLGPVRRACSCLFHPPAPSELSRLRRLIALGNALLSVLAVAFYWNWSFQVDALRYNSIGRMLGRIGRYDASLAAFDAARCSMLSNPREETVLTTETAPETFAGAAYVLEALGEHDLADELIGDVDDLLDVNAVLARPSFYIAAHYLKVGDIYWGRVASNERGNVVEGDGRVVDENSNSDGGVWSDEEKALWRKEGRRYHALAESETRRLARYFEDMVEEEVQKMAKETKMMGRRGGGRNKTLLSVVEDEDEDDEDELIEVRIDR